MPTHVRLVHNHVQFLQAFLTYETDFVLLLEVLENSVLPMG